MNEEALFPNPYWLLNESDDKQTEFVVVLISTSEHVVELVQQSLQQNNIAIDTINALPDNNATEIFISATTLVAWRLFRELLLAGAAHGFDSFVLPVAGRKKKLLICDMDSTIVQTETLDDIATFIGIGEQVSEITARAMRGELDFRKALDERVSLLQGVSGDVFTEIAKTVKFNEGAELLINSARKHGIRTVLVSGGFEPVVKIVAEKLGFDRYVCNKTEIANGNLTGKVMEPIVDAETKLNVLHEERLQLTITAEHVCAVGDGANDLPMLQAAGIGIGFEGKPLVRNGTPYQVNNSNLVSILLMMGIAV
jgi:phosphoserine phosphatase